MWRHLRKSAMRSAVDLQGMAGNIIHAIATTNAIIAGLITVVAMQILAGCLDLCKVRTWQLVATCLDLCRLLSRANCLTRTRDYACHCIQRIAAWYECKALLAPAAGGQTSCLLQPQDAFLGRAPRLVTTMKPEPPNPACMVCGRTQLQLHINTQTTTLGQLIDKARPRVCHPGESVKAAGRSLVPWRQCGMSFSSPYSYSNMKSGCSASTEELALVTNRCHKMCTPHHLQSDAVCATAWQVLKRRLALLEPNVNTAAFAYEEGEGLEPDEVNPAGLFLMTDFFEFLSAAIPAMTTRPLWLGNNPRLSILCACASG